MARRDFNFDFNDGQTLLGSDIDAMFDLGLRYSSGRGVPFDLVSAHMWFNLAALKGHEAAKGYRAEIAAELPRPDVAKAQRMAREWLAGA